MELVVLLFLLLKIVAIAHSNPAGSRKELINAIIRELERTPPKHPQTRCANLFDESCATNPNDGDDEGWVKDPAQTPGKRESPVKRVRARCANLFDESCVTNPSDGSDEGWVKDPSANPGKRSQGSDQNWLQRVYQKLRGGKGKPCTNPLEEGCEGLGLVGSGYDKVWLSRENAPGK